METPDQTISHDLAGYTTGDFAYGDHKTASLTKGILTNVAASNHIFSQKT